MKRFNLLKKGIIKEIMEGNIRGSMQVKLLLIMILMIMM